MQKNMKFSGLLKKICEACLLGFCVTQAQAFDLVTAYNSALQYNADFLGSIAKNLAGQESQVQGRASLLPQINATGQFSEQYLSADGGTAFYHQPTASATLNQVAFDYAKFSQYSKGKYGTQMANLELELAKQQLIMNVAQAYFDVLYATDTVDAIRVTKLAYERQMLQAKQAFKVGTVTIADVNDAQSSYDNAVAQEIQATNDLINKKNIFRNITGLDSDQIQTVVKDIDLVNPNPDVLDKWSEMAQSGNVEIKISDKQLQMAEEDVSIAKGGHLPTVNVVGSYQYQGTGSLDSGSQALQEAASVPGSFVSQYSTAGVGVQANLPVYSGGSVSSQVRQSEATYKAMQQKLVAKQREIDQNVKNAYWKIQNGVSIVKAQTQALKSAQVKLKSDQTGYQVGVRNSVDLVNSEKNYFQAIQNYNQSRYQYLNARLELKFYAGQIDEKFLKDINVNISNQLASVAHDSDNPDIPTNTKEGKQLNNVLKNTNNLKN